MPLKSKPKRTPKRKPKVILPKPKRGTLGRFGYKDVQKLTVTQRRRALILAVHAYGKTTVGRQLRLVQTLNRATRPKVSKIFGEDAVWLKYSSQPW